MSDKVSDCDRDYYCNTDVSSEHVCCTKDCEVPTAPVIDEYVTEEWYTIMTCCTICIYLTASTDAVMTNLPKVALLCYVFVDGPSVWCALVPSRNVKVVVEADIYCVHTVVVPE